MAASYASPTRASQYRSRIPTRADASPAPSSPRHRPSTPDASYANSGRKRSRYDSVDHARRSSPAASYAAHSTAHSTARPSPPPLINTRYRLHGGLDTPTLAAHDSFTHFQQAPAEAEFRRRWDVPTTPEPSARLYGERNGHKRSYSAVESPSESWKEYVLRVAGGVAGKVWEFASEGFKGFAAGGGASYQMTDTAPLPISDWVAVPQREWAGSRNSPVPGAFPHEADEVRPRKKLQTSQGNEWVVVDRHDPAAAVFTPSIPSSHYSNSGSQLRQMSSRLSHSRHHAASSAYRRQRAASSVRLSSVSQTGSPRMVSQSHGPTASFASPRSPSHSPSHSTSTPRASYPQLSPTQTDLERYSAKRRREERQTDASMRKLNQQLQDMIRQGKEALETRYDVMDADTDF